MRVMRANLDGSNIETLVDTSQGDPRPGPDAAKWCVGIAVDVERRKVLLDAEGRRQRGRGAHLPRHIDMPQGQTPANRHQHRGACTRDLPEPIDLDIDPRTRMLYWTDRGDPPRGNTVNRAPLDAAPGKRPPPEIVFDHLMEGIGLALGSEGPPHVHHRLRRIGLQRQSRRL